MLSYIKYLYIYYIILFEFSGIKKVAGEGVMYKKVQHAVQSNRQVKKEKSVLVNDRTNKKPARFFSLSNKNKAKQKVHFEKNNKPHTPTTHVCCAHMRETVGVPY